MRQPAPVSNKVELARRGRKIREEGRDELTGVYGQYDSSGERFLPGILLWLRLVCCRSRVPAFADPE